MDVLRLRQQQQFFSGDCATAGHSNAGSAPAGRTTPPLTAGRRSMGSTSRSCGQSTSSILLTTRQKQSETSSLSPVTWRRRRAKRLKPTPPPPVLLAPLSPANAYARSPEFKLDVAGDKFTPETRIFVDGRELPTKYTSPQQLSATIPAAFISTWGRERSWCARLTITLLEPCHSERCRGASSKLFLRRSHHQDDASRRYGARSGQEQQEYSECAAWRSTSAAASASPAFRQGAGVDGLQFEDPTCKLAMSEGDKVRVSFITSNTTS